MFKLQSLQGLLSDSINTLKRFPPALLAAVIGTIAAIYLTNLDYQKLQNASSLWKIIMCCSLGLTLFLAAGLISESNNDSLPKRLIKQGFSLLLIFCYYFMLPEVKDFGVQEIARFCLFSAGLHLLVSFAPFIGAGGINGFWQFNKTLFIRFLTACLYSIVLYAGLALALLAIDELFKVEIKGIYYADLWWFLAGIFNTWFFLSGVPKQIRNLESITDYPAGLKIFTQFVLLPLVTVYLFILYAYSIKMAAAIELPHGWVSYLVIGFSAAGVFSLLLIWPIQEREENNWIKIFSRWFYRALYPLIILLGLAIFKRISQYGITENRYFVLVIALWLAITATYFLLSKTKNIKVIPISLCFIAFSSSFGPWGAFSVSERSQIACLRNLLSAEKILTGGKIKKAPIILKGESAEKISSIVGYLDKVHGFKDIQPWFTQNLDSVFIVRDSAKSGYIDKKQILLDLMGVENYIPYYHDGEKDFYIYPQNDQSALNIKGFDFYCETNSSEYCKDDGYKTPIIFDTDSVAVRLDNNNLQLLHNKKKFYFADFIGFVKTLRKKNTTSSGSYTIPNSQLILPIETDSLSIQFNFTAISGLIDDKDSIKINNISAKVLIKRK